MLSKSAFNLAYNGDNIFPLAGIRSGVVRAEVS